MALDIGELVGRVRLDTSGMQEGLDESQEKMGGARENARKFGNAAKVAGGIAAGAATGAVGKWAELGGEVKMSAAQAGISTDSYQELKYAFSQMGIEQQDMDRGLQRLTQRMGRAADGNDKYQDAFDDLGVSIKDSNGNLRDSDDVLDDVSDALQGIDDPAERASKAGELLGTNLGRKLGPALAGGSEGLSDLRQEAHDAGVVLSEDSIDAADDFSAKIQGVKDRASAWFAQIGGKIAELPGFLGTAGAGVIAFGDQISGMAGQFGPLLTSFALLRTRSSGARVSIIKTGAAAVANWTRMAASGAAAAARGTATAAASAANWAKIGAASAAARLSVVKTGAAAAANWARIAAGKAILGAVTIAQWAWNAAMNANPLTLIVTLIAGLVAAFVTLWNKSESFRNFWIGIWDHIKSAVSVASDWIVDAFHTVVDFFKGMWDTITAPFRAAFDWVKDAWNSTVGGFGFSVPSWIPVVGGKQFTIPYLAEGGVVDSPTLAMVGEGSEPEAVVPLSKLESMLSGGGGGQSAGGGLDVDTLRKAFAGMEFTLDDRGGKTIARIVNRANSSNSRR